MHIHYCGSRTLQKLGYSNGIEVKIFMYPAHFQKMRNNWLKNYSNMCTHQCVNIMVTANLIFPNLPQIGLLFQMYLKKTLDKSLLLLRA